MIQRTAFPSTLTDLSGRLADKGARPTQPAVNPGPAADAASPGRTRLGWSRARAFLRLPGDLRSFALFVAAVGIVSGGMALHILLSAQILAARVELRTMKADYAATMRQNADLVWQIAEAKSLPVVVARAQELGYRASTEPQYVVRVAAPELDAAPTARMDAAAEQPGSGGTLASQLASPAGDVDSRLGLPNRWLELLRFGRSP